MENIFFKNYGVEIFEIENFIDKINKSNTEKDSRTAKDLAALARENSKAIYIITNNGNSTGAFNYR